MCLYSRCSQSNEKDWYISNATTMCGIHLNSPRVTRKSLVEEEGNV